MALAGDNSIDLRNKYTAMTQLCNKNAGATPDVKRLLPVESSNNSTSKGVAGITSVEN